ncbi:unnamed protein product [Effrenium voratum]|nr:unnamed protein product [Effrenium voratum]|mmetsp:Transcript_49088/g.116918  ORF Transcript_49088/g.116918 Transcript_49088/m.116918 type:complete len:660 (-) Transcript_49088:120-2099(-)
MARHTRWLLSSCLLGTSSASECHGDCAGGDGSVLMQYKLNASDACRGFKTCPAWPMPYKIGEYPETYPWDTMPAFPDGFMWGLGTAAYQIEGAYNEDGRGASIWDTFSGANTVGMPGSVCKSAPCPVNSAMAVKGATGNVANDHYHKFKDDVTAMKSMGVKYYRFSVAWPRVVPTGRVGDGVNPKGIQFYHDLLDELISNDITPIITMYHWDLPQGLMHLDFDAPAKPCDSSVAQGWYECTMGSDGNPVPTGMESAVAKEFEAFAQILLKEYGSKVKAWATFNEAWTLTYLASGYGKAPSVQPYMEMTVWPYVAGHNVILAHLKVTQLFRQMQQDGSLSSEHKIFITNNQDWREPKTDSPKDIAAALYQVEGQLGWYCDPIFGVDGEHDYPYSMRSTLPYMPKFSDKEKALLKSNRPDIFGLNHYGTSFVSYDDGKYTISHGDLVQGKSTWLFRAAWGYRKLLNWVSNRYGDIPIWGTESGWSDGLDTALSSKQDSGRMTYYHSYIYEMNNAIHQDGVKMESFMSWSLMDNFEWEMGYSERFGCLWNEFQWGLDPNAPTKESLIHNAYSGRLEGKCDKCEEPSVKPRAESADGQTRHMKNSLLMLMAVWKTNTLPTPQDFAAAASVPSICFGHGTYQTEIGPVQCSPDPLTGQKFTVPA